MRRASGATASFGELLRLRAHQTPDARAYGFMDARGDLEETLSYAELDARAGAIASGLAGLAGERVLLALPPGPDFVAALFGCFQAGAIAVPVALPRPGRPLDGLAALVADSKPCLALAEPAVVADAVARFAAFPALPWRSPAEFAGPPIATPVAGPLAMLQYTSGSTSTPKGVMLSHANLLHNASAIYDAFGYSDASVALIWLPPFHDMGLIGGILEPMYGGFPSHLMAPVSFLKRPLTWLRAIDACRATTSGGPNFAYALVADRVKPEELAGLDLSCWCLAFNGAEPVQAGTLARFAEAIAPTGFVPTSFYPCYGLAEASLLVAGGEAGTGAHVFHVDLEGLARGVAEPGATPLVSSGRAAGGQAIAIVDPAGRPLGPGHVGEIWVSGPSVARGYWQRESEPTFGARLPDDARRYLRTGDLGFFREGELYVTGRLKDLIILDGRNLYPQDLEATAARAHPALAGLGGAAFAVATPEGERLVLIHEVQRHPPADGYDAVLAALRQAIVQGHDAAPMALALIRPGSLPRTTSGKVKRGECRAAWAAGTLAALATWRLPSA